jgi:transglutaminase-like putative cysteine protease
MNDLSPYLASDAFIDADHPTIQRYAHQHGGQDPSPRATAVALYYAIRDGFRYNPWCVNPDLAAWRSSAFLARGAEQGGHCIDKANLLAACARARRIPARLHFANVRNHIGTEELERKLGTSLLVFHGYTELYLAERWVAATPAFNRELCDHLGVAPLEFDGVQDSIFQQYDRAGDNKFMEYVHDYGAFPSIPYELMIDEWKKHYPGFDASGVWPLRRQPPG